MSKHLQFVLLNIDVGCCMIQMVTHIMRFLDLPDRKSAALVCRRWYYASLDVLLMSDVVMTFQSWSQLHAALPLLCRRSRVNLVLESIDNSIATRDKVASLDPEVFRRVHSLSLAGCDITESLFTSLLGRCTGLEKLDISHCNALFMTGQLLSKPADSELLTRALVRLRELKLAAIRYITDDTFNRLLSVCSTLESLSVAGNQIVFHTKNYLWRGRESAVLTFDNIKSFVEVNASQITVLDFSRTTINDDALSSLARIPDLSLRELRLSFCQEITDKGIAAVCKAHNSLEVLDLTDCRSVTDASVDSICAECADIRVLRLGRCRRVTDLSVCKLKCQQRLQQLDVNACYSVTSRGLCLGLCSTTSSMKWLTSLILRCCSSVSDSFVLEVTCCIPGLMDLDVSSCSIQNASVRAISARLTNLRRLRLAWCQGISDAGLLGTEDENIDFPHNRGDDEVGHCRCTRRHQYSHLHIFTPPKDVSKKLTAPKSEHDLDEADFRPITNLKSLQLLDLTSCNRITDLSVSQVMFFTELRSLYLSLCPKLTDVSLAAVASGLPSLEQLHLSLLACITDAGVTEISEHVRRLSTLDISCCDKLTDQTIKALLRNSKSLRQLDVSLCSGISRYAVDKLEHHFDRLVVTDRRHIDVTV